MNRYFDSIRQGLQEAAEYAQGNENGVKVHHIPEPDQSKRSENGKGMMEIPGPALVLLSIIDKAPQTVLDILSQQSR